MNAKNWTELAKALKVNMETLKAWRGKEGSPQTKDIADWQAWRETQKIIQPRGRPGGKTIEGMETLRKRLVEEQGRKEAALASLRELELYQKQNALIPESEAIRVVVGLLTPLKTLLTAMPRQVAAQCNPAEPAIAELAVRNYLDERIYSTCEKIIKDLEQQTKSKS